MTRNAEADSLTGPDCTMTTSPRTFISPAGILALVLLGGCETTAVSPASVAKVQAPALPPPAAETPAASSSLSYGMVTARVQKGVTTQTELLELFGGPSTLTTDRDGTEVWMYERSASTTSGNYQQSSAQTARSEASSMAAFLGIPLVGIGGSRERASAEAAQVSQGANSVTRSVRTLTFIIKFNADKTVKDYAVRQSSY
jgi:hypothetical protein